MDARGQDGLVDPGVDEESRPILLVDSDNGPQMISRSTREFMALCAIAQHFGRPGTPTDQAWIESLHGHIKLEYPHLLAIRDPATLRAEIAGVREHYNTVRLHQGIGYVKPDDETREEEKRSARPAKRASNKPGSGALPGTEQNEKIRPARDPPMLFDSPRISNANSETRHPMERKAE
ncbi:MAG: integrase core domain-containing protein [Marmoricola sp.]